MTHTFGQFQTVPEDVHKGREGDGTMAQMMQLMFTNPVQKKQQQEVAAALKKGNVEGARM